MAGIDEVETVKTLPMRLLGNTKRKKKFSVIYKGTVNAC
jgi:hypothetical protein